MKFSIYRALAVGIVIVAIFQIACIPIMNTKPISNSNPIELTDTPKLPEPPSTPASVEPRDNSPDFSLTPQESPESTPISPNQIDLNREDENLKAVPISSSQIMLTWQDATNEVRYKIERKTGRSDYFGINEMGSNVTSYTDTNLLPDTVYYYRVINVSSAGGLSYTNEAFTTTLSNILQAPVLVSPGNAFNVSILTPKMCWNEVQGNVNYSLQISTTDDFTNPIIDETEITETCYEIPSNTFKLYSSYYWRVSAQDSKGKASVWSPVWSFKVLPDSLLLRSH